MKTVKAAFKCCCCPGKQEHVYSSERLAAFSDAVFSIIATFSVVPLKFEHETVERSGETYETFLLESYLLNQWRRYIVYLYSFALVADVWFIHSGIFSMIENVDDSILWLNLLLLFLVSFVPYATALISSYASVLDSELTAITICATVIALFSTTLVLILFRAFRRQSLLHHSVSDIPKLRILQVAAFSGLLIQPIIALAALGFSFLTYEPRVSLVFFYCILPASLLVKVTLYIALRFRKSLEHLSSMLFKSIASKTRAEAFSDGVFAIVATLIVLDLTTAAIPGDIDGEPRRMLNETLYEQRYAYASYVTTFLVTGLLWFVQYSMFHFIEKFTPFLAVLNILTLFLVGGLPFASQLLSVFTDLTYADAIVLKANYVLSVRVFSVLIVLAGLLQLLFWTGATCNKSYCMTKEIDEGIKKYLVLAKTLLVPTTGCLVYFCTFSDVFIEYQLFSVATITTPAVFIIFLRVVKCIPEEWICRSQVPIITPIPTPSPPVPEDDSDLERSPLIEQHKLTSIGNVQGLTDNIAL